MLRKTFVSLLILLPMMSLGQTLKKGYRGLFDAGYCYYLSQANPPTIEITTSHGYQFNPYIYLGAGIGFDFTGEYKWGDIQGYPYNKRDAKVDIPLFFNVRANFTKTRLSPFIDARVGAYINNDGNIYANVALGGRYGLTNNIGLSFSVGYEMRKVTVQQIKMLSPTKYNNYKVDYYYTDRPDEEVNGLVFKIGFDF